MSNISLSKKLPNQINKDSKVENFHYKNALAIKRATLEEIKKYYRELRKYECENNIPVKGIKIRQKLYFLIKFFLKLDRLISLRPLTIVGDKRTKTDKSKIYASTHVGRFDIESGLEAINEQAFLLMGDPGETYQNFEGIALRAAGVTWFDMDDKYDAHTAGVRQKKILRAGGNEFCFPEAAWNLDPLKPVNDVHPGFVRRAIETKSVVIPLAIENYRRNKLNPYYVNIGKVYDLSNAELSDTQDIVHVISEEMATLRWEIWEKYGKNSRESLPKDWHEGYEQFIDSIMCDTENGYTVEEIEKTRYKDPLSKKEPSEEEVFSYLKNLPIKKETAFIAKDIYNGQVEHPFILKKTL